MTVETDTSRHPERHGAGHPRHGVRLPTTTWLITGCSTGLGRALAETVAAAGHNVVVTARDVARVTDIAESASTVIADYADTAGKRRKEHVTVHGRQAGDPAKAATTLIEVVQSAQPPAFLLLGTDAVTNYRRVAQARAAEIDQWESLSTSTDYAV